MGHLIPYELVRHPLAEVISGTQLPRIAAAPEVHVAILGYRAGMVLPAHYAGCGHAAQLDHWREALAVSALPCAQLPKPIVACRTASLFQSSSYHDLDLCLEERRGP